MSKQLNEKGLQNELADSAFFGSKPSAPELSEPKVEAHTSAHAATARSQASDSQEREVGPMGPRARKEAAPGAQTADALIEEIRRVVRQPGKDEGTFRFTTAEKQGLTGVVYEYGVKGVRTSQSEITRIAINWLLADYRAAGETSVLARVLRRLNE